jgi:hypothetical protein
MLTGTQSGTARIAVRIGRHRLNDGAYLLIVRRSGTFTID